MKRNLIAIDRTDGRHSRFRALSAGQAMVELALVVSVLSMVLVATCDFARLFYLSVEVNNAARAGVQYGAQNSSTAVDVAGMRQAALNEAADITGLTASPSTYCQCANGSSVACASAAVSCPNDRRTYVSVTTTATFTTLLNYPGIPSSVTVNGSAVMREL